MINHDHYGPSWRISTTKPRTMHSFTHTSRGIALWYLDTPVLVIDHSGLDIRLIPVISFLSKASVLSFGTQSKYYSIPTSFQLEDRVRVRKRRRELLRDI
ncbi:hypothetical protein QCA50_007287 [Cerrena zonata]|uniref:Uncharacterized protein n=1 Tax=Cerrena zonata TaxID=2478898 RepID=A0AAW0GEB3_9APHY